ncbi:MAG: hypothetical protein SFU56_01900 [Capsulimonadales bacterium]|nr:hypothetical protein [Capsulimonadales bacterium]
MNLQEWAERIDTSSLTGGAPTRALVVFNRTDQAGSGRVRFAASFPMRREVCPQPVTVRSPEGPVVPSRLTVSEVTDEPAQGAGRVRWTMELEFVVEEVPPGGWKTYAATFGFSEASGSGDSARFDGMPLLAWPVVETECHAGTLPLTGRFREDDGQ